MRSTKFDLVLCDWDMSKMSGVGLLNAIREDPRPEHPPPFLMATGTAHKEEVKETIEVGLQSYIVKPFQTDNLSR